MIKEIRELTDEIKKIDIDNIEYEYLKYLELYD